MTAVLLVGPYGGRNLGDNLILELILRELASVGVRPVVACSDPGLVRDFYEVETCSLLEYRRLRVESFKRLAAVDALVIGGGEQLAEPRVPNPFWGHLANAAHLVRAARFLGKPVMLWSVGLDELRSPISRWLLRSWVCSVGTTICLRDDASVDRMKDYCGRRLDGVELIQTADPAFGLVAQDKLAAREWLHNEVALDDRGRKIVLLIPANDKLAETEYVESLMEYGRRQAQAGNQVLGWVTDLQPSYDLLLKRRSGWNAIAGFRWLPPKIYRQNEFTRILAGADLIVSARMHPLIAALTQATPSVVLARSAKMRAFARMCELPMVPTTEATTDELERVCAHAGVHGFSAEHSAALARRRAEATTAARLFADQFLPVILRR